MSFSILEIICIEKFGRTHDQFMNTPREIIELMLVKRECDSAETKKTFRSKV